MITKQHIWSYFAWKGPVSDDHAKKSKLVAIKMSVPFSIDISSSHGIWSKMAKAVFYTPRLESWVFAVYFTTFFSFLPFVSISIFMPLVIFLQLFSSQLLWRLLWGRGLCTSKTPADISTPLFHSHVLCLTVWHIASSCFPSVPQQHNWQSDTSLSTAVTLHQSSAHRSLAGVWLEWKSKTCS